MGNRAVITTPEKKFGLYLHWQGGRDSIEAFLEYAKLIGAESSGLEMLVDLHRIIANFQPGTTVQIYPYDKCDTNNYDNGVYIVDNLEIVGREFAPAREQMEYDRQEMMLAIDERQPKEWQIGVYIQGKPIAAKDIRPGMIVTWIDWAGNVEVQKVVGRISPNKANDYTRNGIDTRGLCYVNRWGSENPAENCNNYIRDSMQPRVLDEMPVDETADIEKMRAELETVKEAYNALLTATEQPKEKTPEIKHNDEFDSYEVYFEVRPPKAIRDALKALHMRWNPQKMCWYGYAELADIQKALEQ